MADFDRYFDPPSSEECSDCGADCSGRLKLDDRFLCPDCHKEYDPAL